MPAYPIPENESSRLQALYEYEILDTPKENLYDAISQMAAEVCGCVIGYVSFIDKDRQWMKSTYAMPDDFCEVPREVAFCNVSICKTSITQIPDLTQHEILGSNQYVTGEPHFRFYCGAPLINPQGYALGTLCVLDFNVKELDLGKQEQLRKLAHQVMCLLELHKSISHIQTAKDSYQKEKHEYDQLLYSMMPASIARELEEQGTVAPKFHDSTSVMFSDFVNFSSLTKNQSPAELIAGLNRHFAHFDHLAEDLNAVRIKTIGDAYLSACGIPEHQPDHGVLKCLLALQCIEYCQQQNNWDIRVGIHSSASYSGIVGSHKFAYDVWGDCRDISEQLQSLAPDNGILISSQTLELIQPYFEVAAMPELCLSQTPNLKIYRLLQLKPEISPQKISYLAKQGELKAGGLV